VETAKKNIEEAGGHSRIDLRCGNRREILPEVAQEINTTRFAFLDACHLYDDVLGEFELLFPKLADDALVLFDNTYRIAEDNEDQRVNGALKTILNRYGGNLINLEFVSWFTPGLAMWQKTPRLLLG